MFLEQAVQSGDADVVEAIDAVAHQLRGDGRFLRHGEIRGAGGGDEDRSAAARRVSEIERDAAGQLVIFSVWQLARDGRVRVGAGAGDEEALPRRDEARGDRGNLCGRFSLAEDDFGEALSHVAVMIDARESEIFVGLLAQKLKEPLVRRLRSNGSGVNLVEQGAELLTVHRGK
jgi:hypothetical protein